jgi:hypothetical protein
MAESVCNIDILHANVGAFSLKPMVQYAHYIYTLRKIVFLAQKVLHGC